MDSWTSVDAREIMRQIQAIWAFMKHMDYNIVKASNSINFIARCIGGRMDMSKLQFLELLIEANANTTTVQPASCEDFFQPCNRCGNAAYSRTNKPNIIPNNIPRAQDSQSKEVHITPIPSQSNSVKPGVQELPNMVPHMSPILVADTPHENDSSVPAVEDAPNTVSGISNTTCQNNSVEPEVQVSHTVEPHIPLESSVSTSSKVEVSRSKSPIILPTIKISSEKGSIKSGKRNSRRKVSRISSVPKETSSENISITEVQDSHTVKPHIPLESSVSTSSKVEVSRSKSPIILPTIKISSEKGSIKSGKQNSRKKVSRISSVPKETSSENISITPIQQVSQSVEPHTSHLPVSQNDSIKSCEKAKNNKQGATRDEDYQVCNNTSSDETTRHNSGIIARDYSLMPEPSDTSHLPVSQNDSIKSCEKANNNKEEAIRDEDFQVCNDTPSDETTNHNSDIIARDYSLMPEPSDIGANRRKKNEELRRKYSNFKYLFKTDDSKCKTISQNQSNKSNDLNFMRNGVNDIQLTVNQISNNFRDSLRSQGLLCNNNKERPLHEDPTANDEPCLVLNNMGMLEGLSGGSSGSSVDNNIAVSSTESTEPIGIIVRSKKNENGTETVEPAETERVGTRKRKSKTDYRYKRAYRTSSKLRKTPKH